MVYNSFARQWIRHKSHGFSLLGLKFKSNVDIEQARKMLLGLGKVSPYLQQKLNQLGAKSLENDTRFADTFMHPWESRASIRDWYDSIGSAGLKVMALYDRYAELDDLPNPLWMAPSVEQIEDRVLDYRFENNLEMWLTSKSYESLGSQASSLGIQVPWQLRMTMPTSHFDRFEETRSFSTFLRVEIWQGFLKSLYGIYDESFIKRIRFLDLLSARRLARMGLILPGTAKQAQLYSQLLEPMAIKMDPPRFDPKMNLEKVRDIHEICCRVQPDKRKSELALQRFLKVL
jgi:hypothetical protein